MDTNKGLGKMMGLIGAIIVSLSLPIGIYMAYIDKKRWDRLIEAVGKEAREKQKEEYVFVEEEELGAEHAGLVATDEEEETEALYWS